jgi:hypothetical protein
MKSEDLFKAIGTSNSDFLEHSEKAVRPSSKKIFIRWCGLAACLLLLIFTVHTVSKFNISPPNPGSNNPKHSWIITYNQAAALADTSSSKRNHPCIFIEELDKEELSAVGPGTAFKWMDYSGSAAFDGSGNLFYVIINVTNTDWGGTTTVIMQKGKVVTDYTLPNDPIISDFCGTKVTACEYDAGDHVLLELSFEKDGTGFLVSTDVQPDDIEKAKSDMYDLLECYITNRNIDINSIKASAISEWISKELTLSEASKDEDFGIYMPPSIPKGFTSENIQRYKDQNNNSLSGLWTHGYDELRWKISYLGDGDKERLTSVKDKRNYDFSLYPIPRADSVPDELREIVDNPIFNIDELTLDTIKARTYTLDDAGDSNAYRMHFSVLYGDVIIDVSSKGISPEWMYSQLESIVH